MVVEEGERGVPQVARGGAPCAVRIAVREAGAVELNANVKTEPPPKVVYATVEETRAALIARRIDPDVLEKAIMPPFPLPKPLPKPGSVQ